MLFSFCFTLPWNLNEEPCLEKIDEDILYNIYFEKYKFYWSELIHQKEKYEYSVALCPLCGPTCQSTCHYIFAVCAVMQSACLWLYFVSVLDKCGVQMNRQ
jgi:hypothetical protein